MHPHPLSSLIRPLAPLHPDDHLSEVAACFSRTEYEASLSIPVVEQGIVVGIISRFTLNRLFLPRFGHELYGRHRVASVMNRHFIRVQEHAGLDEAAAQVSRYMARPLTDDFVVCRGDSYVGVGTVMSLLEATGQRLAANGTELQQAYDRLKASQQRLVQSEKMSSLGLMVAGLAHEMNTPLAYLRNNLVMLQEFTSALSGEADLSAVDPYPILADMTALAQDALFGVEQLDTLIQGLRGFSRDQGERRESFDINACIRHALTLARSALPGDVQVQLQLGNVPAVSGVPSQFNQIFINLLLNGGYAIGERPGTITIISWQQAGHVKVAVQDTGCGIDQHHLTRIFDPFFTTKEVGEGTGLGLSICYDIIQKHGGDIAVASKPGAGTRFLISLPLNGPPEPKLAQEPAREPTQDHPAGG